VFVPNEKVTADRRGWASLHDRPVYLDFSRQENDARLSGRSRRMRRLLLVIALAGARLFTLMMLGAPRLLNIEERLNAVA